MSSILFNKEYDYESTYDLGRDIAEALDPEYNSKLDTIPTDEYNYFKGKFKVTILWEED